MNIIFMVFKLNLYNEHDIYYIYLIFPMIFVIQTIKEKKMQKNRQSIKI